MVALPFTRALVTGASSGIGEQFARLLAGQGVALVLVARSTATLESIAAELPVDVEVLTADLTTAADLARVANRIQQDPAIDLVVNNAGFGSGGAFAALDLAEELDQVKIHADAVMTLTHAALVAMLARTPNERGRPRGGILNVSSMAGFQAIPGSATYSACKAFETTFTEAVHLENLRTGIHVTALCPGFVDTPMLRDDAVLTRLPDVVLLDAAGVAAAGLAGVAANRAVVVPGLAWKAAAALSGSMPRRATRLLMAGVGRFR
jgi:short-subunit dehydrogenase